MSKYRFAIIKSKWDKARLLAQHNELKAYIPESRKLTLRHLRYMLLKHKTVYVKPIRGSNGNGVMRAQYKPTANFKFQFQIGNRTRRFKYLKAMYVALKSSGLKRPYIIQKGIPLLRYYNKISDVRVMVQKTVKKEWKVTGIVCRSARDKKIITNASKGAKVLSLQELLKGANKVEQYEEVKTKLEEVGIKVATILHRKYPKLGELGLDIGLDDQLHPWIIEVNTKPLIRVFHKLGDKKILKEIKSVRRAYIKMIEINESEHTNENEGQYKSND
ncbi:YheC/YheD family protein [Longirhabdus pacifica]|uniref:YheC/YheD family protein n=1 Tax=Longirhabdus pacifica TaxID=2305227 RepID=UPI0013E8AA99|nr:YheC/YheD family protein [Longirhabdus pacifica]